MIEVALFTVLAHRFHCDSVSLSFSFSSFPSLPPSLSPALFFPSLAPSCSLFLCFPLYRVTSFASGLTEKIGVHKSSEAVSVRWTSWSHSGWRKRTCFCEDASLWINPFDVWIFIRNSNCSSFEFRITNHVRRQSWFKTQKFATGLKRSLP